MKHPTEWRYTDDAFPEALEVSISDDPSKRYVKREPVFREDDGDGWLHSMGWFERAYFDPGMTCWLKEDLSCAQVCLGGWDKVNEPLAELRTIHSPRQLVEWCMMVKEMAGG